MTTPNPDLTFTVQVDLTDKDDPRLTRATRTVTVLAQTGDEAQLAAAQLAATCNPSLTPTRTLVLRIEA